MSRTTTSICVERRPIAKSSQDTTADRPTTSHLTTGKLATYLFAAVRKGVFFFRGESTRSSSCNPSRAQQYFRSISKSSYNLSSLLSIIPGSQFLNRLRKASVEPSVTPNLSEKPIANMPDALWPTEASRLAAETTSATVREYEIPSFPSPWGFFTSAYIAGLLITVRRFRTPIFYDNNLYGQAILLHRIQNVVLPSPRRARHSYRTPLPRMTLWERLLAATLPLDFSRTATRFVFHLPSVCLLSKMLIIWTALVLQTCEVPLVFGDDKKAAYVYVILEKLSRWAMDKKMTEICWSTFCAVCGAFLIEGVIKALDGLGAGGFPLGGGINSLSPFHLVSVLLQSLYCVSLKILQVSYAFLLHIYSSPVAHGFHPASDLPSRPDKHVVITITIALLQVCIVPSVTGIPH